MQDKDPKTPGDVKSKGGAAKNKVLQRVAACCSVLQCRTVFSRKKKELGGEE